MPLSAEKKLRLRIRIIKETLRTIYTDRVLSASYAIDTQAHQEILATIDTLLLLLQDDQLTVSGLRTVETFVRRLENRLDLSATSRAATEPTPVTAIVVIEGGIVQNVYCPDADITLSSILVDYDLEENGREGLSTLIENLEAANEQERTYRYQPSIAPVLEEKRAQLATLPVVSPGGLSLQQSSPN